MQHSGANMFGPRGVSPKNRWTSTAKSGGKSGGRSFWQAHPFLSHPNSVGSIAIRGGRSSFGAHQARQPPFGVISIVISG